MAWYGNSEGHAHAGTLGGSKQDSKKNPSNFANNKKLAKRAGSLGGSRRGKGSQYYEKRRKKVQYD